VHCGACGFRFFERGLSTSETAHYYRGYRDPDYVRERRRWEPLYTARQHAAQVDWSRSPQRAEALREVPSGNESSPNT
jgi:hypothetical protein